jgi:hypothetical protein
MIVVRREPLARRAGSRFRGVLEPAFGGVLFERHKSPYILYILPLT